MSEVMSGKRVVLTDHQVQLWKVERASLAAEATKISRTIDMLDRKIEAGSLILGIDDGVVEAAEPKGLPSLIDHAPIRDEVQEEENMADASKRILKNAHHALSHAELTAKLRQSEHFRMRLDRNPNYYYTMIGRLTKRGEIVKYRKKLKLPILENTKAKGSEAEATEPS